MQRLGDHVSGRNRHTAFIGRQQVAVSTNKQFFATELDQQFIGTFAADGS